MRHLAISLVSLAASSLASASCGPHARADDWLGRDKALHFAATASIASLGYAGTATFAAPRGYALGVGLGLAVGAGVAKEAWDATGRGDPSWKDLAWDGAGACVGLGLAFGLDAALAALLGRRPPRLAVALASRTSPRATVATTSEASAFAWLRPKAVDGYGVDLAIAF